MNKIQENVLCEIKKNEKILQKLERRKMVGAEGSLKVNYSKEGASRFYHVVKNSETGLWEEHYLPKSKNLKQIKQLANEFYNIKMKDTILEEQKILNDFISKYSPDKKYDLYTKMPIAKRDYVVPVVEGVFEKVEEWDNEEWTPKKDYGENLLFETDRKEFVRSKSEALIANYLNSQSDLYDYRYECPLFLASEGKCVYPDFTIISLKTGKRYYLEHFGLVDMVEYSEGMVWKINTYAKNDIILGRDLIFTMESAKEPLNLATLKSMLSAIID